MEVGLFIKWGKPVPGREEMAISLFTEAIEYFEDKVKTGWITFFEPFFFQTSDRDEETGFFVIKGPVTYIFKMLEEEPFLFLQEKALYTVDHFTFDLLTVGEGVTKQLARGAKVRAELGIAH
jgi:hypothetical protein